MTRRLNIRFLARTGIIAALYAGLTLAFHPISYGPLQVRISEALTVLPFLIPAAIPGLTLGCALANIFGPFGLVDVLVGSFLTLIAALLTARIRRPSLAPLPPILINAVGLSFYLPTMAGLPFIGGVPYLSTFLAVSIGQTVACYFLGYPLLMILLRRRRPGSRISH
ncbi:QueT transporter family protein [Candidatus Zixiibacteriota bacterium]